MKFKHSFIFRFNVLVFYNQFYSTALVGVEGAKDGLSLLSLSPILEELTAAK
jgi:hypothetical protein